MAAQNIDPFKYKRGEPIVIDRVAVLKHTVATARRIFVYNDQPFNAKTYDDFLLPLDNETPEQINIRRPIPSDDFPDTPEPYPETSYLILPADEYPERRLVVNQESLPILGSPFMFKTVELAQGIPYTFKLSIDDRFFLKRNLQDDEVQSYSYHALVILTIELSPFALYELQQTVKNIPQEGRFPIARAIFRMAEVAAPILSKKQFLGRAIPISIIESQLVLFSTLKISDVSVAANTAELGDTPSQWDPFLWVGIFSFCEAFASNYASYIATPDSDCLPQPLRIIDFNTFFASSGAQIVDDQYMLPKYSLEQMLGLCHIMMLGGFKTVAEQAQADAFTDKRATAFFSTIRKVPSTYKNLKAFLNMAERIYNQYPVLYSMTLRLFLKTEHVGTSTIRAAGATLSLLHGSGMTMFIEIYGFLKSASTAASIHAKDIDEATTFFRNFDAIKASCDELGVEWQYYKVFHPDGTLSASAPYPNLAYCAITIKKSAKDSSWRNYQTNAKGDKNVDYSVKLALTRSIKSIRAKSTFPLTTKRS